jgi:predicted ester cyclase
MRLVFSYWLKPSGRCAIKANHITIGTSDTIENTTPIVPAVGGTNVNTPVDNHIIAEGDRVVVFTTTNGTHQGEFIFAPGVPPSGKVRR